MEDLKGKLALVTGIANKRSIAFAIAAELARYGAKLALTYQPLGREGEREKFLALTAGLAPELVLPLDVTDPATLHALFRRIGERFGCLHVLVHSVAWARREELAGRPSDITKDGYLLAQQISAYSLIELVREGRALLAREGGSVLTLTYIGSERTTQNYNVMGMAKSALESAVRYLAMELGPEGVRVNAISAGPIRTLAAAGIKDFLDLMHDAAAHNALKRNVTAEEVGHTAAFLASSLSSGITGQLLYVDGGYNIHG